MPEIYPDVERRVAGNRGVRKALRETRDRGAAIARTLLAPHNHPGGAKVVVYSGTLDYFWGLEDGDTGTGEPAAAAIEYGWTTRRDKPVEGLNIIRRSASRL